MLEDEKECERTNTTDEETEGIHKKTGRDESELNKEHMQRVGWQERSPQLRFSI